LISIATAVSAHVLAPGLVGLAGYVYCLIGVSEWSLGAFARRRMRELGTQA
jgi:hypothetical protein